MYRERRGANAINWVDVSRDDAPALGSGLTQHAAMKRFHVREPGGRLRSGAAAFAALWKALPAFRLAGQFLAAPPMVWLAEGLYRLYLPLRPRVQRLFAGPADCQPCRSDNGETRT